MKAQGYLLISVMVALMVMATISLIITQESAIELSMQNIIAEEKRLQRLTQAGAEHAKWALDKQYCGPFEPLDEQSFSGGSYSTTITLNDLTDITRYKINTTDDATIDSANSAQNFGSAVDVQVYKNASGEKRGLYRFDLQAEKIAANAIVLSAVMRIYVSKSKGNYSIDLHRIVASWSENNVKWGNIADDFDAQMFASVPMFLDTTGYIDINITPLVQGWVNEAFVNEGVMLKITPTDAFAEAAFVSQNAGMSSQQPILMVSVSDNVSTQASIMTTGKLDDGQQHTIDRRNITLYQPFSTLVQRMPNDLNADTYINEQQNTFNFGHSEQLRVSSMSGDKKRSLLKFDLNRLPQNALIKSAKLSLYHNETQVFNESGSITVHQVKHHWNEGSQLDGVSVDGVTWLRRNGSDLWASAGAEIESSSVSEQRITTSLNDWEFWDITALVRKWHQGVIQNNGLLLQAQGGLDVGFASRESGESYAPKLIITYQCQCGESCQPVIGDGHILMVVKSLQALDEEESDKKTLLQSWGYEVSLLSQDASDFAMDFMIPKSDVLYIPNTVTSTTLGTRLASSPINIVSEKASYFPDFGFASGYGTSVGTVIDITNNSHEITSVFSQGELTIYHKNMEIGKATGSVTPATLATVDTAPSLIVFEKGDALVSKARTANGVRVSLPFGSERMINWNYVNNNGRILLQRALQWGVGKEIQTDPMQKIYWVDNEQNSIRRADKNGDNIETIISSQFDPTGIDIDSVNEKIYWSSQNFIKRSNLDGSDIEEVFESTFGVVFDVKVDPLGGKIYWSHGELSSRIMSADLDGKNARRLTTSTAHSMYISLDKINKKIYVSSKKTGHILRLNFDGTGLTQLVNNQSSGLEGNAVDTQKGKIYWSSTNEGWIRRANLDGSQVETIITGLYFPQDIVIDEDEGFLYFTEVNVTDSIKRAKLDGSQLTTIVADQFIPKGITVPVTVKQCDGIYRDQFNTISFDNNDGDLTWSTPWLEINESDGPARGDEQVIADQGVRYRLRLRDNDNQGEGVEREFDLSGAATARISLVFRRSALDKRSDYVSLQISNDASTRIWTELRRFEGPADDARYFAYLVDISDFIGPKTRIRLVTSEGMGRQDAVFFDDIRVICEP